MTEPFTPDDVAGLAAKVDGLDLTDGERAALQAVLDRAAAAVHEVEGFRGLAERDGMKFGLPTQPWVHALGWIGPDPGPGEK